MRPDPLASGPHSTYRRGADGVIDKYGAWNPNHRRPGGFDEGPQYHGSGRRHYNKDTGEYVDTPHFHDESVPGGVRPGRPDDKPGS